MYTQLINIVTGPLVFFFATIAPPAGIYASYIIANKLHNTFFAKGVVIKVIVPAFILGLFSTVMVALSGAFAAGILTAQCRIGEGIECGAAGWLAFPYIIFCIPIGILLFFAAYFFFFRKKIGVDNNSQTIILFRRVALFLLPVMFLGTFFLYLPTNEIATKLSDTKADRTRIEQISKATANEYVCSVNTDRAQKKLTVTERGVYVYDYYQGQYVGQGMVGTISGNTFMFNENRYPYEYERCYNSNGEDFSKKFLLQIAQ